jgi:hypothetical protein
MFHEGMEVQRKYIDQGFKRLEKILEKHMGKNEMKHLEFEERLDRLEERKSTV